MGEHVFLFVSFFPKTLSIWQDLPDQNMFIIQCGGHNEQICLVFLCLDSETVISTFQSVQQLSFSQQTELKAPAFGGNFNYKSLVRFSRLLSVDF